MSAPQPVLRPLKVEDEPAFRRAVAEFARSDPGWTFAFQFDPDQPFADYVRRADGWPRGENLEGFVPSSYLVAVVGTDIVGRVSLRHQLNADLMRIGGHIGFGVVPSWRRQGHATTMLRLTLPIAAGLGLRRVLVTCDDDNLGSRAVIERNGGVLESKVHANPGEVPTRRYWIDLGSVAPSGSRLAPGR